MKKNNTKELDLNSDNLKNQVSRRQWLGRVSVPAVALLGAGMIGPVAKAAGFSESSSIEGGLSPFEVYNVKSFGAKGDGKTLDTLAIQSAIDRCSEDNGGIVYIPAGDFVTGTLELKSNVTIHLAVKGRLLGSGNRDDYQTGKGVPPGNGNLVLLYAANAENIGIEGQGTIDGNGAEFYTGQGDNTGPNSTERGYMDRPHLVIFYNCQNIRIRDAFFTRSAYHCFRILLCKNVNIDGIRIYNRVNKNNDGFHFNNCQYVHIINCDIKCQDDGCALFGSNQFITVSNCTFSTRWSIFRFGGGEAQNITISDCIIYETYGCPIKISAGRVRLENFIFSNIIMRNVTGPIGIGFSGASNNNSNEQSFVRNIVFSGIRATVVPMPINHPDIPFDVKVYDGEQYSCITLNGMNTAYLENISFTDVHVKYSGGGSAELAAKRNVPKVAQEYFGVWGESPVGPPAYGLYARNVKGLTLQNVRFEYEESDLRPALVFDNVQDASISNFSAMGNPNAESLIRLINSKDILFTGSRVLTPSAVFLGMEGDSNEGIMIDGGDLRKAKAITSFKAGANDKMISVR